MKSFKLISKKMSEKKEITIEHHSPSDPEISNCGYYLLSNGLSIFYSDMHRINSQEQAKELVDLIINAQKMRDMMEKVLNHGDCFKDEIKELLTN
jgi:hypothetical protein